GLRIGAGPTADELERFVYGLLDERRIEQIIKNGLEQHAISIRERQDACVATDRRAALVIRATPVEVGPAASVRATLHDQAASTASTLCEACEQVLRGNPERWTSERTAIRGAHVDLARGGQAGVCGRPQLLAHDPEMRRRHADPVNRRPIALMLPAPLIPFPRLVPHDLA